MNFVRFEEFGDIFWYSISQFWFWYSISSQLYQAAMNNSYNPFDCPALAMIGCRCTLQCTVCTLYNVQAMHSAHSAHQTLCHFCTDLYTAHLFTVLHCTTPLNTQFPLVWGWILGCARVLSNTHTSKHSCSISVKLHCTGWNEIGSGSVRLCQKCNQSLSSGFRISILISSSLQYNPMIRCKLQFTSQYEAI